MNFQRIRKECARHLWLKGKVAGESTVLGVVYLWTGTGAKEENRIIEMVKARSHSYDLLNLGSLQPLKPEDTVAPSIGLQCKLDNPAYYLFLPRIILSFLSRKTFGNVINEPFS
ncbi:hypothetical protein ANAPRD1_01179 [Anaplasma phagocytophilum]|nr:hypothetical protein ANAPRD1_01179 [Anaplasma phagocytophilum]